MKRRAIALLGATLILLLISSTAIPHLWSFVEAGAPPPRTTTGLKEIVEDLMNATPPEHQVDYDSDGLYDKVEIVIGTDFNNTDSDFDLLDDYSEIFLFDSDPSDPDTNSDGLPDYIEVNNVPFDADGDTVTNIWDYDNDGDGVNDDVDLSPFSKSTLNEKFHFDITIEGKPTYVTLQFRPENSENLKLYYQLWDWPNDSEGSMKDLDGSLEDLKVIPQLNVTVNIRPNQSEVAELGILVTDNGMYVPVFPVWENSDIVAFSAQIFYNASSPMTLSMDAELMWRVLGYRDEAAKALKAANGKYVSANADGSVTANATEVAQLEKFQWIELGEDKVALKLKDGPYLSLANNDSIQANGYEIGKEETFRLIYPSNTTLCLEAANGKCVAVAPDESLIANGSNATASAAFELKNKGYLGEWTILVTYQDSYVLTGFTISQTYGTQLGVFHSADKQQTIRANLLMAYDFLRNSTTQLSDMPTVLSSYNADVSSFIGAFSTSDEALAVMSNTMLPNALDSLPPNQNHPVIMAVEEKSKIVEMSQFLTDTSIVGKNFSVNMTAESFITTKSLKLNFYNTTSYEALDIADIIRYIDGWQLSEEARFSVQTMVLAWNTGEQHVIMEGVPDVSSAGQPEWFVAFPLAFESMMLLVHGGMGLKAYQALKSLRTMGWNSASIARFLQTGTDASGFTFWSKMCKKISDAKDGFAGIKGLDAFKKIMKGLEVLGLLIDVGLSILTGFLIADQIGGHIGKSMGASFGIVAASYAIIYAVILYGIGQIPYVGWIISLALVLADIFGNFSDKLMGWLMKAFGPKDDAIVEGWLEDIGMPSIIILDKDLNGLDVGDRITIKLDTTSKVNVTAGNRLSSAQSSWYRPYISIDAPAGSFSNTSATGIPPTSTMNTTTGNGWKMEQYETGAWIEPGIGMPNFPVVIKLNINYYLRHDWHHWILFVPCYHHDAQQGTSSSPFTTIYYDVLPENINDFRQWRGVTPLDHDYDGLADVNETRSNPFRYDTDGDGLNDKFEASIGTDAWNYDTDSDGLPDNFEYIFGTDPANRDSDGDGLHDYLELSGYLIELNYLGDSAKTFKTRVFSDPRMINTDGDGVDDYMEYWSGLNPNSMDTDGDGLQDAANPIFVETNLTFINKLNMTETVETGRPNSKVWDLVDIDVDAEGNLYVLRYPDWNQTISGWPGWSDGVFKYDPNGTLITSWFGIVDWSLTSIAVDSKNGYFYNVAPHRFITQSYLNGTFIQNFDPIGDIRSMDVDADGFLYVACGKGNSLDPLGGVKKYASNGTMVASWGGAGDGPDKFHNIGKIAVDDKNGFIYISDSSSSRPNRVTKWNKNGIYITSLPDGFGFPNGLDVDADGYVYVADTWKNRIQKFDSNGMLIATWGSTGNEDGNFTSPFQVAVDLGGRVFVADTSYSGGDIRTGPYPFGRIQKFSQVAEEKLPLDDPLPDRDGDGLLNEVETAGWDVTFTNSTGTFMVHVDSDPMLCDSDFDGLTDDVEFSLRLNPRSPDTEGDGVPDLTEYEWHYSPSMNPAHFDTDGEGLDDGTELTFSSDPTKQDSDEDELNDLREFLLNTNPNHVDTDGDGLSDYAEVLFGSDPTSADTDRDFLFDGAEFSKGSDPLNGDTDLDGFADGYEVLLDTDLHNSDTDGDGLPDGFEVDQWLNPLSEDTDGDGLSDFKELEKGTNPWDKDSDSDGIPDGEDSDSNGTHIPNLILAYDPSDAATEFAGNLTKYTNVTIVSKEELLANYTNSPYIVLVGRPDGNGTIGNLIQNLLMDSGDILTNMIESDVNRFAVRYGLWNNTQTIVTLSTPYPSDHLHVLDTLRSKTVTMLPNSAIVKFNTSLSVRYSEGGSLNHTDVSSAFLSIDEIDIVKATDTNLQAILKEAANDISVQITKYNSSNTPSNLTKTSGLGLYEQAIGKYINITVNQNLQNTNQDIINSTLIQFYYKESDLDRNRNGILGDPDDIYENTLTLYFFNETSGQWIKLSRKLNWVNDFGVNTTNVELYGERYAGYVWAEVSHLSLYGVAGLTYNRPPDVTNAYPSQSTLWPPNKKPVPITIEGVIDPDGDDVTITVTSITCNEPITLKDAYGTGTDTAWLLPDRLGNGNGRVYLISFIASDGKGGETIGNVSVFVPHNMGK